MSSRYLSFSRSITRTFLTHVPVARCNSSPPTCSIRDLFFPVRSGSITFTRSPSLNRASTDVLVLREVTERPDVLRAATVRLVGTRRRAIVEAVSELCEKPEVDARFPKATNPYGDGGAADRIAVILADKYSLSP